MRYLGSLLAITVGVGTFVGIMTSGCGGETAAITTGGEGASGGDGSGGNPASSSSSGGNTGGTGGSGSGGCSSAADCSDGFSCTIDSCEAGACGHMVGPNSGATACPMGQICNLAFGCVELIICANDQACLDKLDTDPCKANIHCDQATSVCSYTILDKDLDGEAPVVCGGKDCDDSTATTNSGATDVCDGKDNNCNGSTDENAMCPGLSFCEGGFCLCPPDNACGSECIDKMTSDKHCGMCNNTCFGVASCINGQCVCPAGSTTCPNGICVDTKTDAMNCGSCGSSCAAGYSCVNSLCTCLGTPCGTQCIDTTNDPFNCGGCNVVCPVNSQCQNSTCTCPSGQTFCGGQCVDTKSNTTHCGGCNKPCSGICQNGMCTPCSVANLYFFGDVSGSMASPSGTGEVKLDAMRNGINNFIADPLSVNLGVGIGYHPVATSTTGTVCLSTGLSCMTNADCGMSDVCVSAGGTTSCVLTDYTTPWVAIGLLPGNQTAITNSLTARSATGNSTPPPGLRGALQYAKNYATANPTQKTGVVFFLDGMPSTCAMTTSAPDDLLPIAQQFANGTPRVVTYVIGIGTSVSIAQVNQIAAAGGTNTGFLTNSTADITMALNTIRSQFRTCP